MRNFIIIRFVALFFLMTFVASGITTAAATNHHVIKEWVGDFTSDGTDHQEESAEKAGSEHILSLPQHPISFSYHIGIKPVSIITLSEKSKQLFVLSILTPPPEVVC